MYHSNFSVIFSRGARLAAAITLALALLGFGSESAAAITPGATITVNTTSDIVNATDGFCSLREAISAANSNTVSGTVAWECAAGTTGLDTINFALPGGGPTYTITVVGSVLPEITSPVIIDGTTQSGYSENPLIILDPVSIPNGLNFQPGSSGSKVLGLSIVSFTNAGVVLDGGGVTLQLNWIGTSDGTSPAADNIGIYINSSNNVIGGLDGSGHARTNVISGNGGDGIYVNGGSHNIIQGNYIGTAANGLSALGNANYGILLQGGANTLVGGTLPRQGNVISGNPQLGLFIGAVSTTKVQGNFFGVGSDGVTPVWNGNGNIEDDGGVGTLIGGQMPQASNIVAFSAHGIYLGGSATTITITGNLIGVDANGGAAGASADGILFDASPTKTTITGNLISHNSNGINFQSNTPSVINISQNCITGNFKGASTTGGTESVAGNWWGVGTGPNTPGGDKTSVSLTVIPWLTKAPSSCLGWAPKTIKSSGSKLQEQERGCYQILMERSQHSYSLSLHAFAKCRLVHPHC